MPREYPIERVRNIGIIAHIDAGKTTITERILFYTGKKHKIGEVHKGEAEMDWMEQERERGITITAAATTCFWPKDDKAKQYQINIIDTPGHIDFTVEVQRSLRVLDGAVVVFDGKMGVEPQSETVWHQADMYKVPRLCFINKVNLIGGDFYKSLQSIKERLSPNAFAISLPIGAEENLRGIIDLVGQKAYEYTDQTGMEFKEIKIPQKMKKQVEKYRAEMIEKIVENDDKLTEKFLEGEEISNEELKNALRKGTVQGIFFPVLGGDGRRAMVKNLLDSIVEYLPNPIEIHPEGKDSSPFVALVFKVATDPYVGQLSYFRTYSGTLTAGSYVLNSNKKAKERIGRILRMHADKREEVKEVYAGEIVAVVGLKRTSTGDTLCDASHPVVLEKTEFPEPVISVSIEPKTKLDQEKMSLALRRLSEEDPTFKIKIDQETGQTIISGMGELHLEIIVDRMLREFSVDARVGQPQVAYKETIKQVAEAEGKYIRQSGGRGQYGHVWLKVEPQERGKGFEFVNAIRGGVVPQEFIPAVEKGVKGAMDKGILAGYPLVDLKVTLYDGSYHEVDSSEQAFKIAASEALQKAARIGGPVILEPIMKVQVITLEEFMGKITGDLSAKRGQISQIEDRANVKIIDALVPLASMFGYVTRLRSMTQGRASYTMEFSHYAEVPKNIVEEMIKR